MDPRLLPPIPTPPAQRWRSGWSQRPRTSSQLAPRSSERNSPPGSVPHHNTPGSFAPPASSAHMRAVLQASGRPHMSFSSSPSGLGG